MAFQVFQHLCIATTKIVEPSVKSLLKKVTSWVFRYRYAMLFWSFLIEIVKDIEFGTSWNGREKGGVGREKRQLRNSRIDIKGGRKIWV